MNNPEIIEAYFKGNLQDDEKKEFEDRCLADTEFAAEVAAYVALRDGIRQLLNDRKKAEFAELRAELSVMPEPAAKAKVKQSPGKLAFYLAAACIIVVLGYTLWFRPAPSQRLSGDYIQSSFSTLGQTMGAADSTSQIQQGIAAYNAKDYVRAEQIFGKLARNPVPQPEVIKNLGITFLATGKYDQAVVAFHALAGFKLYSNPGLFYQAIALMKRNKADDLAEAKKILNEVVQKDLEGSNEAKIWLKKL